MQRVLIVDDDDAMRSVIRLHLENIYEVIDTGSPEAALAMALAHKPNAILLDLSMPGLSGFELCQTLSSLSITQSIPIFIVSGEDERNRAFCESLGASRYFTKPIDFTKLKKDLAWALQSKPDERRADVRVQLRVNLRLKAVNKDGSLMEVRVTTENMSNGGFLCACAVSLEKVTTAEVYLCGEHEYPLGSARLARSITSDTFERRYGFQFLRTAAKPVA